MVISINTQARNESGSAITNLIDIGTGSSGFIEFRTGPMPNTPQELATGELLATCNLSSPAFGAFANGKAIANTIQDDNNIATTGVCNWFRLYNRDKIAIMDGKVTVSGGDGDIQFDDINFIKGGTISIISLQAIMPAEGC